MKRIAMVLSLAALASSLNAEDGPLFEKGYPEYLPDTSALHDRLHDHPWDEKDRKPDEALEPVLTTEPHYPMEAVERCGTGWVLLEFVVTEEGSVEDVDIVAEDYQGFFGKSARQELYRWKFKPPAVNGEPASVRATLPIIFSRARCSDRKTPTAHEASLGEDIRLPVSAPGIASAHIVFVPVHGQLLGAPDNRYVHGQKWVKGDIVPLSIEHVAADLGYLMPKWRKSQAPEGMKLDPFTARFARLAVVARTPEGAALDAYLADNKGRDLALVYVDGAASITGVRPLRGNKLHYDIAFPGAGFYWVEFRARADGDFEVVLAEDVSDVRLVIASME